MVLFRLNQVPDRLYVHFLNLVGIEPFPPSVARADLTFWLSAALDQPVAVPQGTQVTTALSDHRPTSREPWSSPPAAELVDRAAGAARRADQHRGRRPAHRRVGRPALSERRRDLLRRPRRWLSGRRASTSASPQSLAGMAIRLTVAADAEGIGVDPLQPPLAWEVWSGEAWITAPKSRRHHRRAEPGRRDRAADPDAAPAADHGRQRARTGCGPGCSPRCRASRPTRPRRGSAR